MLNFFTFESKAQLFSAPLQNISGDKVGIDISNPQASLDVRTKDAFTNPFVVYRGYTTGGKGGPYAFNQEVSLIVKNNQRIGLHTENPLYNFHLQGTGFVSKNFLVNDRLGIGTNNPTHSLHVNGTSKFTGMSYLASANVQGVLQIQDGTAETNIKLHGLTGQIRCREVKVDLQPIPDYVFAEDYNLMPLAELQNFVNQHQHLPNIKSEAEYKEVGGIDLTEMNLKLLEKVEELTLYILQLEERITKLEK